MSSDQHSDVPGGYFVGRPANHAEKTEEPPHTGGEQEQNPATPQTPGGYFVGRPGTGSYHKQQQEAAVQQQTTKPSFLAKCCPCLAGGGAAE